MRPWLIASFLIVAALPGSARAQVSLPSDETVCAQAEAAFRHGVENKARILRARKEFSEATEAYFELHRRGIRSPALYLSLGNAAVLADRWPEAIWAYQFGLKLDANDRRLREHLAFARGKVIYPLSGQARPAADSWPIWLPRPTYALLLGLFTFAYSLLGIGITVALFTRSLRPLGTIVLAIVLVGASGSGLWHESNQAEIDHRTPLVVIADNTDFYRGNAVSYPKHPALPILPRGLEARQVHRRGEWLQIRLTTGEVGWVHGLAYWWSGRI